MATNTAALRGKMNMILQQSCVPDANELIETQGVKVGLALLSLGDRLRPSSTEIAPQLRMRTTPIYAGVTNYGHL